MTQDAGNGQPTAEGKVACPKFTPEEAIDMIKRNWDLDNLEILTYPGYNDQNMLVKVAGEPYAVLKISSSAELETNLVSQNAAMNHVKNDGFQTSYAIKMQNGDEIGTTKSKEGVAHLYRLLKFVPGTVVEKLKPIETNLLRNVGEYIGKIDISLTKFSLPKSYRKVAWDPCRFLNVRRYMSHLATKDRHEMVSHVINMYEELVVPKLDKIPRQVVQNDPNGWNVFVDGEKATGIIDFGDMLHTIRVNEVAITGVYLAIGDPDPLNVIACVAEGYHKVNALSEDELSLVFPLACSRLAMSLTMSAYGLLVEPENTYVQTFVGPGWPTLRVLVDVDPSEALHLLRERCGFSNGIANNGSA
eukprot:Rmarinus@m.29651